MIDIGDIRQLAGLLEGEGSFTFNGTPQVLLGMTDLDVVVQAAVWLRIDPQRIRSDAPRGNKQRLYRFSLNGGKAAAWMMTLYPLLGIRRRMRIKAALKLWKAGPGKGNYVRKQTAMGVESLPQSTDATASRGV